MFSIPCIKPSDNEQWFVLQHNNLHNFAKLWKSWTFSMSNDHTFSVGEAFKCYFLGQAHNIQVWVFLLYSPWYVFIQNINGKIRNMWYFQSWCKRAALIQMICHMKLMSLWQRQEHILEAVGVTHNSFKEAMLSLESHCPQSNQRAKLLN